MAAEEKSLADYAAEAAAADSKRGIGCPRCGGRRWEVDRTVQMEGFIARQRRCTNCSYKITTRELPEGTGPPSAEKHWP